MQGQFPHEENINAAAAHCPTCGTEYRRGFTTCADDGTPLRPGPPPREPPAAKPKEPSADHPRPALLARLYRDDAYLLAGALREEGFEVHVDPVDQRGMPPSHRVGQELLELYVPEPQLARALDAARRIRSGER